MSHAPAAVQQGNAPTRAPDLASYDRIIVAFSGGKDSIACLLTLIEAGVPASRIDAYHHDVDGAGPSFMDWPCTTAFCRASRARSAFRST
jgi:predicted phosphoadenosine phosphosulfate sulfurtransferase